MTVSKKSTRRTLFNLWIPTKAVDSGKSNTSPTDSGASESPAAEPIIPGVRRDRFRARLTRSGSRILLFLGLRGSSKGNKDANTDTDCCNSSHGGNETSGISSPSSLSGNSGNSPVHLTVVGSPQSEPIPATPSQTTLTEGPGTLSEPLPDRNPSPDGQSEVVVIEELQQNALGADPPSTVSTEQPCQTNSKFVDRFSHRISCVFSQPTVIRRAHLRSRPSVLRISSLIVDDLNRQGDGANDSSDASTTPSSAGSPNGDQASPLTSLTSGGPSPSSDKNKQPDGQECAVVHWPSSPEHDEAAETSDAESHTIIPSIKTVETASVAKICLELNYDLIFRDKDSRQQRQLELEQQIYAFPLTAEERLMTRHNWILRENHDLRQWRVLRSNRYRTRSDDTIAAAGYKPVKVLGKGSFGVVRLVRRNHSDSKMSYEDEAPTSQDNQAHLRPIPLGIFISAVEGAKKSRRRCMMGEKKEVYAMKVIKKAEMIRNCQEGHIRAERDFLVASEASHWVVPLIASFQDTNNLYLVMDYMVGGDFLALLIRRDTIREDWARFYVAEMILCIEEAHRLCWIHRDVKPDNFLISASGHLKISDFGLSFNGHWSHDQAYYKSHRYRLLEKLGITVNGDAEDQNEVTKAKDLTPDIKLHNPTCHSPQQPLSAGLLNWRDNKGRRRYAKSVVGTSQYMAPEVIRGDMYDGRCDWWSVGIILYECLYGFTPFACENRHDTKIRILQHRRTLQFPREKPSDKLVSHEAMDLITRILQEREYRLCSSQYRANDILTGRPVSNHMMYSMDIQYRHIPSYFVFPNDAADIKLHPFFRGINWEDLHMCQPPMIPRVKDWEDTRYFDDWKLTGAEVVDQVSVSGSEDDADNDEDGAKELIPGAQIDGPAENVVNTQVDGVQEGAAAEHAKEAEKTKEKKRPRDKILRDKQMAKTALNIRKRGAFLGYTYRRPSDVALAFSTERGRQMHTRGQLTGLYA